jgi:SAM-dependent methyltransferase
MARTRWHYRLARLMRVKPFCNLIFQIRYLWFTKVRRSLRTYDDHLGVSGHQHNVKGMLDGRPSDRILKLIQPLAVIDRLTPSSSVLAIGCRFETDLLYLTAYGFAPENIRGLDMLSYSPWVDLGNMHAMPYKDSSWDAVLLGWVLTYSDDPKRAAREIVRIVRPGGLVAIGLTCYPDALIESLRREGKLMGTTGQIQSVRDVLDQFGDHIERIYFQHDVSDRSKQGPTLVIFAVKK